MLALLALRNVLRNLRRLAPMIAIIVLVFIALIVGNGVLQATGDALYDIYASLVAGDITVSPNAEQNFTIFGSDQLLVGQYLIPPTIVGFQELEETVSRWPEVSGTAGLVSSAARVEIGGRQANHTVFGVDFDSYSELFGELDLAAGSFPESGEPGILVQEEWGEAVIGEEALLATASERSFTLRVVPVTGVFRYPVEEELLDRVVLVDAPTARALNGYLYGSEVDETVSDEDRQYLESDVEDLFGSASESGSAESTDATDGGAVNLESLLGSAEQTDPKEARDVALESRQTLSGAWNFLLVRLKDPSTQPEVMRRLERSGYTEEAGYLLRDWRSSVGGTAQLVWYLRLMFNVGLLFVSFGAVIIATNALVLSVLERTGEIGTFRALGASRIRVGVMIGVETLLVVLAAAIIGILLGWLGTMLISRAGIVIDNQYIRILFGGEPLRGSVTLELILQHLGAAAILTAITTLYPLKRALSIQPVEAIAR